MITRLNINNLIRYKSMEKHELFSLKKTEEKQLLLIMKFFFTFLLIGIGHCMATSSYSQNTLFTMKTSQKTVKQVFQEIEKNSEYIIFYMDPTNYNFPQRRPISQPAAK